jgi:polysaccharide export outer membrane protein
LTRRSNGSPHRKRKDNFMAIGCWLRGLAKELLPMPIALVAFLVPPPSTSQADTRLDAGDVIEIAVAGVPELRWRAAVNLDGDVSLPLVGEIKVVGLPMSELRTRVRDMISQKPFRQRTVDGRENVIAIWPGEVTIDVVEYRPIYLNGDVSRPGEQKHRPGMTVRQAIALAGGFDIMRFRMTNPLMESADFRGEYEALWTEFAREHAVANRLREELGEQPDSDVDFSKAPIPPSVLASIQRLEATQLRIRQSAYENERAHFLRSLELTQNQLVALRDQQQRSEEGSKADAVDLENVKELQKKGMVPMTRVLDARRSLLWSSTAFLQVVVQVTQLNKELEEMKKRLQLFDDQRRIELLRELQTSTVKATTIRARLQALSEKLMYSTAVRSQLLRGTGGSPDIVIFRKGDLGAAPLTADEDTALLPGDAVEVTLRTEHILGFPYSSELPPRPDPTSASGRSGAQTRQVAHPFADFRPR